MLDATKAFDRVEYCKLVRLLPKKNVPQIIIRLLLHMYLFHFTKVAWNGTCSNSFRVLNGVRQGAILYCFILCLFWHYWSVWVKREQVVPLVIFLLVHSHMLMALFYWHPVRTLCGMCYSYVMITRLSLTLCLMPPNPNVCAAPPLAQLNK